MRKYDCTILVNSCDKYEDILDTFFELLHRFWPDIPFEIALSTESLEYKNKYFEIKNLHPKNKECSWTERIEDTLNQISSNYVLLMLDDLFLYDYVQTEKVLENLQSLKENDKIVNFTYWPILNDTEESVYPGFKKRKEVAKYKVAAILGLWNKKHFLKYVKGYKENIWEFEPNATIRSNTLYKSDEFYVSKDFPKQIFPYNFAKYGLFSGKWFKANKELFKSLGIKIAFKKRGFYNEKERGLTKSFISSFKLESYIVPQYDLSKDIPIHKYEVQRTTEFKQEYNVRGAKDIIYWCLTDQCGFGIKNLAIKVKYKDKSEQIIDNKLLFGSFKRIGKLFVFNAGQPHVYIPTLKAKLIETIEISGLIKVPLKKWLLKRAFNVYTKPKIKEFYQRKQNVEKEFFLVDEIMSCITMNPNIVYYQEKSSVGEQLETTEQNTKDTFNYTIKLEKEPTGWIEWNPSIHTGYSIGKLKISYVTAAGKQKAIKLDAVEGLPKNINDNYIFIEPGKIKIKLPKEQIKELQITGTIRYPLEKEILAYLLNGKKQKNIREKVK